MKFRWVARRSSGQRRKRRSHHHRPFPPVFVFDHTLTATVTFGRSALPSFVSAPLTAKIPADANLKKMGSITSSRALGQSCYAVAAKLEGTATRRICNTRTGQTPEWKKLVKRRQRDLFHDRRLDTCVYIYCIYVCRVA